MTVIVNAIYEQNSEGSDQLVWERLFDPVPKVFRHAYKS